MACEPASTTGGRTLGAAVPCGPRLRREGLPSAPSQSRPVDTSNARLANSDGTTLYHSGIPISGADILGASNSPSVTFGMSTTPFSATSAVDRTAVNTTDYHRDERDREEPRNWAAGPPVGVGNVDNPPPTLGVAEKSSGRFEPSGPDCRAGVSATGYASSKRVSPSTMCSSTASMSSVRPRPGSSGISM